MKKTPEGLSNPNFDEQNVNEFSPDDDPDMFTGDPFKITMETKNGATSMTNPLYQDPYADESDSPLCDF